MADGLVGRTVTASDFRVPQHATADLSGREVLAFDAYGKHMLTRFSGGLTLHTHFEMDGSWQLVGPGRRLPSTFDDEVRLVLHTDGPTAYALRMPVLELVADALRSDAARSRGLFREEVVEEMLREPNAHRTNLDGSTLWQLGLLELWLQSHVV